MALKCGIVGLPNVGKSTLFNCLTKAGVLAANYPFCTIEPNIGIVGVPDDRLNKIAAIVNPQRILPATVEFVDIAGLVKGAATGEGLGNKFLAHIRETNAIIHIVRCFVDENIHHVAGRIAPQEDIEVINTELALADLETVERAITRLQKSAKTGDKTGAATLDVLHRLRAQLDQGKSARSFEVSKEEAMLLSPLQLLTLKPILYVANVSEKGLTNNPYVTEVKRIADEEHAEMIVVSANLEAQIAELDDNEKTLFLTELNLAEPGLNRLIRAANQLLQLETFFTAGEKEVRAWTIPMHTKAPQAAGVIHTDFEKGFIRAEVIGYEDFINHGGEQGAKNAGKWRLEGKDYIIHDGDIIHFRFNV